MAELDNAIAETEDRITDELMFNDPPPKDRQRKWLQTIKRYGTTQGP